MLRAEDHRPGLTRAEEWKAKQREANSHVDKPDERPLTDEEQRELAVARYCRRMLSEAQKAREPYDTWDEAWDAYIGDLWPKNMPPWKAKITVNKIRAFIHFMQAVMTDNKPRISVQPVLPGTEDAADLLTKLVDRHWDENDVQNTNSLACLYGLIWGTGIVKPWYDPKANGGRGKHIDEAIAPYRVYVNRGCKGVDHPSCRYIIHVEPMPLGWIYDNFPEKAHVVKRMRARILGDTPANKARDFLNESQTAPRREGIISPMTMDGETTLQMPRDQISDHLYDDDTDEIEVAEFWFRDESEEEYECHKYQDGKPQMEDVLDEIGLPVLTKGGFSTQISPIDGMPFAMQLYKPQQRPVMKKAVRKTYPNGRVVLMAGPVVLRDIPNPYQIDGFPFAEWKDQDVGVFWGQGEPPQLRQMNIALSRVVGQIYDNLNLTGNTSYLVDKNSGLNYRTWKNKPGSLLPVDDVTKAIAKVEQGSVPSIAGEFLQFIKGAMSEVAGMNDSLMGGSLPANTAFATIDQVQESGAAILRQKVRNFERMLKRQGKIRVQLIQQFPDDSRPIRIEHDVNTEAPWEPVYTTDEHGEQQLAAVVPPASDVEVQFRAYKPEQLQGKVEFNIVPDSSLSTSPVGMYNRYMDMLKAKLIDPISWHEHFRIENWRTIVKRLMAMQAAQASGGNKPGPKPRQSRAQPPKRSAPPGNVPSAEQNAIMR